MEIHNNNCDGAHCTHQTGEVRVLPAGGDSNAILCYSCYHYEMSYRRERNKVLAKDCQHKLPAWDELNVYSRED